MFLYTKNEQSEREIKTTIPYTTVLDRINLTKDVKDLYSKNYRHRSSAGVEAHSVLPSTGLQAPAGSQPLLSRVPGSYFGPRFGAQCPERGRGGWLPAGACKPVLGRTE